MIITINVDCTPEEARAFLGLPDLKPMQDKIMQQMQEQMAEGLRAMSPEEMLKSWMPAMKSFEQMQDVFQQMTGAKRDK
jgi:Family of unknown function (DUF6489)